MARPQRRIQVSEAQGFWRGTFDAMGSPCELLLASAKPEEARELTDIAAREAWRVEDKFSRYLPGNVVADINKGDSRPVDVDDETANLLDFAGTLFDMSDGQFDVTSGVLRGAWTFDGSDRLPDQRVIDALLQHVGWTKVRWQRPEIVMAPDMQIDFGGIGKEYAVDRAAQTVAAHSDTSCLINFGGDLVVTGQAREPLGWQVGIESLRGEEGSAEKRINLKKGALATSGDARRYVLKDGRRYGHILNPVTGWPIDNAPRSITVAADTCTQAGMLATLAMLKGPDAESWLTEAGVRFWALR